MALVRCTKCAILLPKVLVAMRDFVIVLEDFFVNRGCACGPADVGSYDEYIV